MAPIKLAQRIILAGVLAVIMSSVLGCYAYVDDGHRSGRDYSYRRDNYRGDYRDRDSYRYRRDYDRW
jgi:hypothetical protein